MMPPPGDAARRRCRVGRCVAAPLALAVAVLAVAGARRRSRAASARGNPLVVDVRGCCRRTGTRRGQLLAIVNNAATLYYLPALAVAIGFRMNLFNIGVDGQYRLAAMLRRLRSAAPVEPARRPLHLLVIVARRDGRSARCGPASPAVLKVTRGVSEVISTIMLNAIATGLVASFLRRPVAGAGRGQQQQRHPADRRSRRAVARPRPLRAPDYRRCAASSASCSSRSLVGVAYWLLLGRTRFGFDLRATGLSRVRGGRQRRRRPSGWSSSTMLLSGARRRPGRHAAAARRVVLLQPRLPAGLGFTGIAIALLGRNHPVGIAFGALLFAFLERSSVDPQTSRRPDGDRRDHAGLDRAVGRRRLRAGRAGSASRRPSRAVRRATDRSRRRDRRRRRGAGMTRTDRRSPSRARRARTPAPHRRSRLTGAAAARACAAVLLSLVRVVTGADDITSQRHRLGAALRLAVPIGLAGARRPVGRARRRRQHRPRGHAHPRHLVRRLGRLRVRPVGRRARRASPPARSAGCCTPSRP